MKKLPVVLFFIFQLVSCGKKQEDKLIVGLIKPSMNHLPLEFALEYLPEYDTQFLFEYFHSGWETNEALVAGKIDVAIMPFTYIWMDVSENKSVKIISFFERESDGIIAGSDFSTLEQLQSGRMGVLKNSTLEIIPEMIFNTYNLKLPDIVHFRTPMDMASALNANEVDALSYYVPSIFNFSEDYNIIYWFGETYPGHTCCNIAATEKAITHKRQMLRDLINLLEKSLSLFHKEKEKAVSFAQEFYGLDRESVIRSLEHTVYFTGLQKEGMDFEKQAANLMYEKGYLKRRINSDEVYHQIQP